MGSVGWRDAYGTGTGAGSGTGSGNGTGSNALNCAGCATEATLKGISDKFGLIGVNGQGAQFSDDQAKFESLKPNQSTVMGWLNAVGQKIGLGSGGQCQNANFVLTLRGTGYTIDLSGICSTVNPILNWFAWALVVLVGWRELNKIGKV